MFVGLRMSRNVPVCAPDDGLDKAIQVMREKKVRQLVVAEGDRVVGVLSRIDLQHVLPSTATTLSVNEMNYQLSRLKVRDYMTRKVVSVAPDTTIEEAARLMHDSDVSGLPVVKGERLVGIINRTMMLEVFIEEMGLQVASSRITLELDDTPGQILNVAQVLKRPRAEHREHRDVLPRPDRQATGGLPREDERPGAGRGGAARGRLQDRHRGRLRPLGAGLFSAPAALHSSPLPATGTSPSRRGIVVRLAGTKNSARAGRLKGAGLFSAPPSRRSASPVAAPLQFLHEAVAVVALDLDDAVAHGAAAAAEALEVAGERLRARPRRAGGRSTTVTPLPLRPFVSRPTRTAPSPRGRAAAARQTQAVSGRPQARQRDPWPLE